MTITEEEKANIPSDATLERLAKLPEDVKKWRWHTRKALPAGVRSFFL